MAAGAKKISFYYLSKRVHVAALGKLVCSLASMAVSASSWIVRWSWCLLVAGCCKGA